jgi:hypothetical protein
MSASDFAEALSAFPTQSIVLVNSASASGPFVAVLSGANRIVVTATKSGSERNETLFARYFVEAFAADGADVDKDERVSVLEAYNYARREVTRYYEERGILLTEHALLDDNGDGVGSGEPDPEASDGAMARTLYLVGLPAAVAGDVPADPELAALYSEKQQLEEEIAALRQRKDEMDAVAYEQQLEELLVELTLTTRAIRELEEKT